MQSNQSGVRPIAFLAVVPLSLLFLAIFLDRFVLIPLLIGRIGVPALLAVLEAVAIVGIGFSVRRLLARLSGGPSSSEPTLDFLVGYPIFGTVCFLMATLSASAVTMALPLVACVAGIIALWKTRSAAPRPSVNLTPSGLACVIILGLLGVLAFIQAQAPATSLDELAYHLAVPHIWLTEGRAVDLPLLSHSYFPLGTESADLPLLALLGTSGAVASHLLHLIAALCATVVVFRWIRSETSDRAALLATAAIVSTPALAITAGWSLTEWPLIGIALVTAIAIERLIARNAPDDRALLMAAVAAGLLTKYTFALLLVALLASAVVLIRQRAMTARPLLMAAVIGSALGSIFFFRNLILTGNPVAPFLSQDAPAVTAYRAAAGLGGYAFDPVFIDEALGASLTALALCVFFVARRGSRTLLGVALAVTAIAVATTSPSSRILLPFLAVAAAFAAPVLNAPQPWLRRSMSAILLVAIAAQTFLVAFLVMRSDAFTLLSGQQSDEQYAAVSRTSYAIASEIDRALPSESRTLVVGMNELFPFSHRVRGGGNFDGERMSRYLAEADLRGRLRRDGVTHIAIVEAPALATADARKQAERAAPLSGAAVESLRGLVSASRVVLRTARVLLVELR